MARRKPDPDPEPEPIPDFLVHLSLIYKFSALGLKYVGSQDVCLYGVQKMYLFRGQDGVDLEVVKDRTPTVSSFAQRHSGRYPVETPEQLWQLLVQWGYAPAVPLLREGKIDSLFA